MSGAALDHLIVACRDLERAVSWVEERLGVTPVAGGRHPGVGTRNALLPLGPRSYLEIVGVDPEQPEPARPRWFGLDELEEPRLTTWCVRPPDLDGAVRRVEEAGMRLGPVQEGSRERTDGAVLRWKVSDPWAARAGGAVPFLIDWLDSPHPGDGGGAEIGLRELRVVHPDPRRIGRILEAIGLGTTVVEGERPGLRAVFDTPQGRAELG